MLKRHVLLRVVDIAARSVFACTLAAMFTAVATFIALRIARVPIRDIGREIPSWYTPQSPHTTHVPDTPALRRAALRAQFDYVVSPVPELSERSWWPVVGCGDPIRVPPDLLFIQCYAAVTDCAVLYRCTEDGKLLWKSFDNRSP